MKELLKKAKETKTVEELKALARENNFDIDDNKLGDVSGGRSTEKEDYYTMNCPRCSSSMKVDSKKRSGICGACGYTYNYYFENF